MADIELKTMKTCRVYMDLQDNCLAVTAPLGADKNYGKDYDGNYDVPWNNSDRLGNLKLVVFCDNCATESLTHLSEEDMESYATAAIAEVIETINQKPLGDDKKTMYHMGFAREATAKLQDEYLRKKQRLNDLFDLSTELDVEFTLLQNMYFEHVKRMGKSIEFRLSKIMKPVILVREGTRRMNLIDYLNRQYEQIHLLLRNGYYLDRVISITKYMTDKKKNAPEGEDDEDDKEEESIEITIHVG